MPNDVYHGYIYIPHSGSSHFTLDDSLSWPTRSRSTPCADSNGFEEAILPPAAIYRRTAKGRQETSTESTNKIRLVSTDTEGCLEDCDCLVLTNHMTSSSKRAHNFQVGLLLNEVKDQANTRSKMPNKAHVYEISDQPFLRLPSAELWENLLQ